MVVMLEKSITKEEITNLENTIRNGKYRFSSIAHKRRDSKRNEWNLDVFKELFNRWEKKEYFTWWVFN